MISTAAIVGLGVLSAATSLYASHKRNQQVDEANQINRDAAQLSYQAQQETNDLQYRIFQENQAYNSPANLKAMYDALGLNGDAIVANQGFTPTAAPVMNAPHMDQVNFQAYEKANPVDTALNSLLTAFSSARINKEIDKVGKDMALTEAQTENCRQSTINAVKDALLKDQQISENDVNYLIKTKEFEQLNLQNANLIILNNKMNQELDQNKQIHQKLLRMYDDKHAIESAQGAISKYHMEHVSEEFTAMIKKAYSEIRLNLSNADHVDLLSINQKIANFVADHTKHNKVTDANMQSDKLSYERDKAYYEWLEAGKKSGYLNADEEDSLPVRLIKALLSGYSVGLDILADPLRGLLGGNVSKNL